MRLRHIATVDFCKGEHTHYGELIKSYPNLQHLGSKDVILLRSRVGNQLIFVLGFDYVNGASGGQPALMIESRRLRLTNGQSWNPLMLTDYAQRAGVRIEGIKKFELHIKEAVRQAGKDVATVVERATNGHKESGKVIPIRGHLTA